MISASMNSRLTYNEDTIFYYEQVNLLQLHWDNSSSMRERKDIGIGFNSHYQQRCVAHVVSVAGC